jgi:hypothetical protein
MEMLNGQAELEKQHYRKEAVNRETLSPPTSLHLMIIQSEENYR